MGSFLEPGEQYSIPFTKGELICKSLSFREQRQMMKLLKELQKCGDPERAMEIVELVIAMGAIGWKIDEEFSVDALMDKITFQEAMDLGKKIMEGGKLSEEERKK